MLAKAKRLLVEEEGQGMVEYAIILALISVVAIVVITVVGNKVNNTFEAVNSNMPD